MLYESPAESELVRKWIETLHMHLEEWDMTEGSVMNCFEKAAEIFQANMVVVELPDSEEIYVEEEEWTEEEEDDDEE